MQEDFKDIDLSIRSMLEDAEVKAPRGAWSAISSRLEAAAPASSSASSSSSPWIRWAGAGLAFAGAVAASLVLFLRPVAQSGPELVTPAGNTPVVAQLVTPDEPASEAGAASVAEEAAKPKASHRKAKAAAEPVQEQVPDVEIEETYPAEQTIHNPEPEKAPAPTTKKHATVKQTKPAENADAAYFLEDEPETFTGKTSLYANGALGGNSSDIAFRSRAAMMAPSSVPTTGMAEHSESTYGVPFTVGLGVRTYILPGLSIGSGIDYTLLTRTFSGEYTEVSSNGSVTTDETGSVFHSMSYLGVPLNLYYDVISSDKLGFYVYGGGEAEFCVANNYTLYANPDIHYSYKVKKPQFSVGVGLGVEFKLSERIGLYLDPEVKYYFHCDQPKNVRTEKPLMVNFNAGLRFDL